MGPWPGVSFRSEDSESFYALLGTCLFLQIGFYVPLIPVLGSPNFYGMAYFLIEHKAQLGIKVVDELRLFLCGAAEEDICGALHIMDWH